MTVITGIDTVSFLTGFSVDLETLADEGWGDAGRGSVTWRTLVDADRHPSQSLAAGVATLGPGGTLEPHRHGPAEFYFGLDGEGTVTVDGVPHRIAAGVAVYLPPDSEHGTVAGSGGLRMLYVFPVDRLDQVDYRFTA